MEMDSDTGMVLLVEQDSVDMDQWWNLEHLYGYVSSEFQKFIMQIIDSYF